MEGDHVHCMSCVNQRCMARPDPGISCDLMACPLVCGAVFHSCKAAEHHLMCPLMRVPCLNSGYGCPATLVRSQMYAHLEVCPAGVVCCTMEWNRWPISCLDYTSYESLSRGVEEAEQLDMALALQDQRTLLESLKVIAMAPSVKVAPRDAGSKESRPVDSVEPASEASPSPSPSPSQPSTSRPLSPSAAAKQRIASGINGLNEEHFSKLYEATVETARTLAAALEFVSSANGADCVRSSCNGDLQNGLEDEPAAGGSGQSEVEEPSVCSNCSKGADVEILNANGPLSEGREECEETSSSVMVRDDTDAGNYQGKDDPAMAPPLHVSQGVVHRAGHVVVEDKLQNQHSSRVQSPRPCYSPHRRFSDRQGTKLRPKMEDKAVDTSGLDQDEDSMGLEDVDLIMAALLFCLEESRECRRISDTVYVDGYRVDFGTQTFTFPAAILVTNTRVGDMASASACDHAAPQLSQPSPFLTLRLGLVLEALEVEAVPHNRYLPCSPRYQHMFPFVCGQSFRRDQFSSHFTNVHGDIHAGLNGWMEHRCPLAYYGCTFSQRRFYPSTRGAKVVHDRHLRSFGVQPCPLATPASDSQSDQLSVLPMEILWLIAGFLDSFSLCQLSLVSRTMRELCASLLQTRGIVDLQWERRPRPGAPGTVSWQIKNKVWRFSTAFSPVSSWRFTDLPSMSDHLKKCHFNTVEHKTEPVPLPAMCTARDGHSLRHALRPIYP